MFLKKIDRSVLNTKTEEELLSLVYITFFTTRGFLAKSINYDNMDDAIEATVERARSIFTEFMQKPYEKLSFMRIGLRWIDFARTEPNLYKLLFVPSARGARLTTPLNVFMNFEGLTEKIVPIVASEFGLSGDKAYRLYNQMIIHAHGMACILVSGHTDFTEQSIREIFSETVESLVGYYKKSEE